MLLVGRTTVMNCSVCAFSTQSQMQQSEGAADHFGHPLARNSPTTLQEVLHYLHRLFPNARSFCKKVCCVVSLIIAMPSLNAVFEDSFSTITCITCKSYLSSTTGQNCLNHTMLLNIYKKQLDNLDIVDVSNEFVSNNERQTNSLGNLVEQSIIFC